MPFVELFQFQMDDNLRIGGFNNMKFMSTIFAALVFSTAAFSQILPLNPDVYQVRYANLNVGDSYVNITNTGQKGATDPTDNICANIYVFDSAQELVSCCACPLSPMHLKTLSVKTDLVSNTLTPGVPTAVTVAMFSTIIRSAGTGIPAVTCNAANAYVPVQWTFPGPVPPITNANDQQMIGGMRAWMTTPHTLTGVATPYLTETEFSPSGLSAQMMNKMTSYCGFIQANGSGFGICKSCRQGAQGPAAM
jgi:hypothetical protein